MLPHNCWRAVFRKWRWVTRCNHRPSSILMLAMLVGACVAEDRHTIDRRDARYHPSSVDKLPTGYHYGSLEARIEPMFARYPSEHGDPPMINQTLVRSIGRSPSDVSGSEWNFAGKYILMSGHCGTGCQLYAVINPVQIKPENKIVASFGAEWRRDSRLVIANPPSWLADFGAEVVPSRLRPRCYVWTEGEIFSEVDCGF